MAIIGRIVETPVASFQVWCKNVPMTGISDRMWPTLENLTIINAELGRLTSNMFSQYRFLKRLHLESANIRVIEPNAFAGLHRLRVLRLFGNQIDRLEARSMAHLSHVKEVYVTDNRIKRIGKDAFLGSTRLGTVDLRNNPVERVEAGAFNGLKHVERLLLPSDIVLIEPGAFENLTDVNYLEIRKWKPKDTRWGGVAPHTFRGLRDVRTLQIEKSDLGTILPHAFDGLTGVEYLYIRNSLITRIRKRSFVGMHRVRRLGLTKNFIDHIDYMALFADRSPPEMDPHEPPHKRRHAIRQLDINKNRLNCTCPKNAWILRENEVVNDHSSILRNNTCSWPSDLESLDLYTASTRVRDTPCVYVDDSDSGADTVRICWMTTVLTMVLVAVLRREPI